MALAKPVTLYTVWNAISATYVGQTKNRITDRFQGHMFDIKHTKNTTVARHFHSQKD